MANDNILTVCGYNLEEVRVLGTGSQGSVSLCRDTSTGKLFALKVADPSEISHEFYTSRFLTERGVVGSTVEVKGMDTVIEIGPRLGKRGLLMEYYEGGELLNEVKKQEGGRLGERKAAMVIKSISEALWRCHRIGVMHRDVKLENILLLRAPRNGAAEEELQLCWLQENEIVLADFGLSKGFRKGYLVTDGDLAGTAEYIAPEMSRGMYDEKVDVWSLGIVLHVLLIGGFPPHIGRAERAHRALDDPDDPWSLLVRTREMCPDELDMDCHPIYSELSEDARSLLAGMLRKDPRSRLAMSQVAAHPWLLRTLQDQKQQQQQPPPGADTIITIHPEAGTSGGSSSPPWMMTMDTIMAMIEEHRVPCAVPTVPVPDPLSYDLHRDGTLAALRATTCDPRDDGAVKMKSSAVFHRFIRFFGMGAHRGTPPPPRKHRRDLLLPYACFHPRDLPDDAELFAFSCIRRTS